MRMQPGNGARLIVTWRMHAPKFLLLAVMAGGAVGCGGAQGEPPEEGGDTGRGYRRVVNVEVERQAAQNFTSTIRLTGVALAMRDVVVSAEEAGVVRRVLLDKGSPVRTGNAMIALILVTQFNSVVKPVIIPSSVIMSTIGVLVGLLVFQMPFVIIMTGVGVISLAGIVVNNAIVLIDYIDVCSGIGTEWIAARP